MINDLRAEEAGLEDEGAKVARTINTGSRALASTKLTEEIRTSLENMRSDHVDEFCKHFASS